MSINRVELKNAAKQQIHGNIAMFFLCSIIMGVIIGACSMIPIAGGVVSIFVSAPLAYGLVKITLSMTYGQPIDVNQLFIGFKDRYLQVVWLNVKIGIFVFLWSLLLVVPGIIKMLSYSMSFFIMAENPEMDASAAMKESMRIMDGHKSELFVLFLSFIPWYLLCCITFGIASIYVNPYQKATVANFYHCIKADTQQTAGDFSASGAAAADAYTADSSAADASTSYGSASTADPTATAGADHVGYQAPRSSTAPAEESSADQPAAIEEADASQSTDPAASTESTDSADSADISGSSASDNDQSSPTDPQI